MQNVMNYSASNNYRFALALGYVHEEGWCQTDNALVASLQVRVSHFDEVRRLQWDANCQRNIYVCYSIQFRVHYTCTDIAYLLHSQRAIYLGMVGLPFTINQSSRISGHTRHNVQFLCFTVTLKIEISYFDKIMMYFDANTETLP